MRPRSVGFVGPPPAAGAAGGRLAIGRPGSGGVLPTAGRRRRCSTGWRRVAVALLPPPPPVSPAVGIVDTTLRDGGLLTRLPPADLDHLLALLPRLPLAAIEVGTPASSPAAAARFAAACRVLTAAAADAAATATTGGGRVGEAAFPHPLTLVALSPPAPAAIRATAAALAPFPSTRLHTYLPAAGGGTTSATMPSAATLERVTAAVEAARAFGGGTSEVAFTVAAATGAPTGVVTGMAAAAAAAGANVVGVADSAGLATPAAFGRLVSAVVATVGEGGGMGLDGGEPGGGAVCGVQSPVRVAVHTHGPAAVHVAAAGVAAGATLVEATLGGGGWPGRQRLGGGAACGAGGRWGVGGEGTLALAAYARAAAAWVVGADRAAGGGRGGDGMDVLAHLQELRQEG
ncbi:hypothetical protein MMPV_002053 [Pyropia vietnamensis]